MPLGKGVRYRYKKGTKIRIAWKGKKVVEVKNMATGKTSKPKAGARKRAPKRKK